MLLLFFIYHIIVQSSGGPFNNPSIFRETCTLPFMLTVMNKIDSKATYKGTPAYKMQKSAATADFFSLSQRRYVGIKLRPRKKGFRSLPFLLITQKRLPNVHCRVNRRKRRKALVLTCRLRSTNYVSHQVTLPKFVTFMPT